MLIIEKTAVTLGEKEEMNDILSKCQSLKGEYTELVFKGSDIRRIKKDRELGGAV